MSRETLAWPGVGRIHGKLHIHRTIGHSAPLRILGSSVEHNYYTHIAQKIKHDVNVRLQECPEVFGALLTFQCRTNQLNEGGNPWFLRGVVFSPQYFLARLPTHSSQLFFCWMRQLCSILLSLSHWSLGEF